MQLVGRGEALDPAAHQRGPHRMLVDVGGDDADARLAAPLAGVAPCRHGEPRARLPYGHLPGAQRAVLGEQLAVRRLLVGEVERLMHANRQVRVGPARRTEPFAQRVELRGKGMAALGGFGAEGIDRGQLRHRSRPACLGVVRPRVDRRLEFGERRLPVAQAHVRVSRFEARLGEPRIQLARAAQAGERLLVAPLAHQHQANAVVRLGEVRVELRRLAIRRRAPRPRRRGRDRRCRGCGTRRRHAAQARSRGAAA